MKVGDLVKFKSSFLFGSGIGIIIETGAYTGNKDVKVCWTRPNLHLDCEDIHIEYSKVLEVINEAR